MTSVDDLTILTQQYLHTHNTPTTAMKENTADISSRIVQFYTHICAHISELCDANDARPHYRFVFCSPFVNTPL